jgi:hypothetical protein
MRAARIAAMRVRGSKVRWAKLPKWRQRRHDPPTRAFPNPTLQERLQEDVFADLYDGSVARKRPSKAVLSLLEPSNKQNVVERKVLAQLFIHSAKLFIAPKCCNCT